MISPTGYNNISDPAVVSLLLSDNSGARGLSTSDILTMIGIFVTIFVGLPGLIAFAQTWRARKQVTPDHRNNYNYNNRLHFG